MIPWYTALDHRALGLILSRREWGGRGMQRERQRREGREKGGRTREERDEGC